MPNIPGTIFTIESGGAIFVPEGELAEGTAIHTQLPETVPMLSDGIQARGGSADHHG
jgi:hypothetical protein